VRALHSAPCCAAVCTSHDNMVVFSHSDGRLLHAYLPQVGGAIGGWISRVQVRSKVRASPTSTDAPATLPQSPAAAKTSTTTTNRLHHCCCVHKSPRGHCDLPLHTIAATTTHHRAHLCGPPATASVSPKCFLARHRANMLKTNTAEDAGGNGGTAKGSSKKQKKKRDFTRRPVRSLPVYDLAPDVRPLVIVGPSAPGYEITDRMQNALISYVAPAHAALLH
jgi:hypothetical protein